MARNQIGENNPMVKLSDDDVDRMLAEYREGAKGYKVLAREYGVSRRLVQRIVKGERRGRRG